MEEIYSIIDSPGFLVTEGYTNNVCPLFKEFGDRKASEGDTESAQYCQLEINIQHFQIRENKLCATFTGTTSTGDHFEYPEINSLTDKDYQYLINRQKQTTNPWLKIRYSHFLWLSRKKHVQFALDALSEYRDIITALRSTIWNKFDKHNIHVLRQSILNAFYLAKSTANTDEINKIKKIVLITAKMNSSNQDQDFIRMSAIGLMLDNSQVFKAEDFKGLRSCCIKIATREDSFHTKIDIFKVGEKISKKLNDNTVYWNRRIAQSYEALTYQREDGTNIASIMFCQRAIKYYKKIKHKTKVEKLEKWYKHLKETKKFSQISHEIDVAEIRKELQALANTVLKESTESIIRFLMNSPLIFPSYETLFEQAQKNKSKNPLLHLGTTVLYDEYGHVTAHFQEDDELINYSMMQSYSFRLRIYTFYLIQLIVFGAIKANKLSASKVLLYLKKYTWLGQDMTITYTADKSQDFNWITVLAPGISDFFSQMHFYYQNPVNEPNFVLAIDSLTMKIEGILRDMCALKGVTTFFQTTDGKGRDVVKEKDINVLLREDVIKNIFSKDDLLLLQFLLIDKAGVNLRNKIAHTLIRDANDYSFGYLLLLIVAILRIAKYDVSQETKSE